MELEINSNAWRRLHKNIFDYYGFVNSRQEAEIVLSYLDITVITDADGRWQKIKFIMSDEDLTLFLLTWA